MTAYRPLDTFSVADFAELSEVPADDPAGVCSVVLEVLDKYLSAEELVYLQQASTGLPGFMVAKLLAVSEPRVVNARRRALKLAKLYLWFHVHRPLILSELARTTSITKTNCRVLMTLVMTRATQSEIAGKLHVSQQTLSQRFRRSFGQCRDSAVPVIRDFVSFMTQVLYKGAGL